MQQRCFEPGAQSQCHLFYYSFAERHVFLKPRKVVSDGSYSHSLTKSAPSPIGPLRIPAQRPKYKVDEQNEQIAHRRIVAGRRILRNHARNNNSQRQVQSRRKLGLWQGCHEVAEKSSKIVPLGAPASRAPTSEHFGTISAQDPRLRVAATPAHLESSYQS